MTFFVILILFILITAVYSYFQIDALYKDVTDMEARALAADALIEKVTKDVTSTTALFNSFSPSTGKTKIFGQTVCGFACMLHQENGFAYPSECSQLFPSIPCS